VCDTVAMRLWLFLAFAWSASNVASAQQLVVADVTYEHSATTTFDSHYHLDALPGTPPDLTSPIDYASGDAVVRLEVFTKPSDAGTRFQVCFEAMPTYACTDQAPTYTTVGIYTWTTPFSRFYQGNMVDWSLGLGRIALILKDTMNRKPSPENVGATESARYMPTQIRVTVTLVPPGATYSPPADTIDAGVVPTDAAVPTDAGADATVSANDASTRDGGAIGRDAGAASPAAGCAVTRAGSTSPAWALLAAMIALRGRHRSRRAMR
jgi:hypothetical protein